VLLQSLEVAADWQEPMTPWQIMQPSIARAKEQPDPQCSTQTYHHPTISHTYNSEFVIYYSFPIPRRVGG